MLKEKIQNDLKEILKSGMKLETDVLRMISAAIKNKEIEKRKKETGLTDDEIVEVLLTELKKRYDAASQYEKGERKELAEKELEEAKIIKRYLPEELAEEDLRKIILDEIKKQISVSQKDFGKLMGQVMQKVKGRASGDVVSKILKEELSKLTSNS